MDTNQQNKAVTPAILIAEDDPNLLVMLRRLLRAQAPDHVVIATICGDELLPILDSRPVALVITDYRLAGGVDGMQLAASIKAASPETSIIMISGGLHSDTARQARSVDAYLQKPFAIDQLVGLVHAALDRSAREVAA
jgi:two-component system, cell cycle response regulator CpdR